MEAPAPALPSPEVVRLIFADLANVDDHDGLRRAILQLGQRQLQQRFRQVPVGPPPPPPPFPVPMFRRLKRNITEAEMDCARPDLSKGNLEQQQHLAAKETAGGCRSDPSPPHALKLPANARVDRRHHVASRMLTSRHVHCCSCGPAGAEAAGCAKPHLTAAAIRSRPQSSSPANACPAI